MEPSDEPPGAAQARETRRGDAGPSRVFVSGAAAILAFCGGALVTTSLLTDEDRLARVDEPLAVGPLAEAEASAISAAPAQREAAPTRITSPSSGTATAFVPGRPTERRPPAAPADLGAETGAANARVRAVTVQRATSAASALEGGAGSPRRADTAEAPLVTKKMARALARAVADCMPVDIRASRRANPKSRRVADRPAMLLELVARDGRLEVIDANVTAYGDLAQEHLTCARDLLRGKLVRAPPRLRTAAGERAEFRWILP